MSERDWMDDCGGCDAMDHELPWKTQRQDSWVTKSGNSIRICDMTDGHLLNAFNISGDDTLFREMVWRLFSQRVNEGKR